MIFEFDPAKSAANLAKHGIDFRTAQELWHDSRAIGFVSPFVAEDRRLLIGTIADKLWTAVFTLREDRIRIISVRRSRTNEAKDYGAQDHQR